MNCLRVPQNTEMGHKNIEDSYITLALLGEQVQSSKYMHLSDQKAKLIL